MSDIPRVAVPPAVAPAESPGGLFSAVTFREAPPSLRWGNGVIVEGVPGGTLDTYGAYTCEADSSRKVSAVEDNTATFDAFTVYATYQATPVGYSKDDVNALAMRRLLTFEEVSAEAYFWQEMISSVTSEQGVTGDFAVAVGKLEHYAIREYGGGVIHVPRWLAHKLPRIAQGSGNRVALRSGVQIVLGSGYGKPGENSILIATPPLFGYRSEVETPYDPVQTFDKRKNNLTGIAERRYVIGWDAVGKPFGLQVKI